MNISFKDYLDLTKEPAYLQLHQYYTSATIFDALGVARQENPHSSFIRWMLDPAQSHQLEEIPFRRFMQTLCLAREKLYLQGDGSDLWRGVQQKNLFAPGEGKRGVLDAFRYGRYDIKSFQISREYSMGKMRRADIYSSCRIAIPGQTADIPFYLVIENKINSNEHDDQTNAYADTIFQKDAAEPNAVVCCVYLNAYKTSEIKEAIQGDGRAGGNKSDILPACPEFLSLNYQYLLDGVFEPMEAMCTEPSAKQWLSEYIRTLGQAIKDDLKNNSNEYVMAIAEKEKACARKLWRNPRYKELIISILDSMNANHKTFALEEKEERFWKALAYTYSVMIPEFEKEAGSDSASHRFVVRLSHVAESAITQPSIKVYYYTPIHGERTMYRSYSTNSVGKLCRDILHDLILYSGKIGTRQEVEQLRTKLQGWKCNWLREVILFEDEIPSCSEPRYFSMKEREYIEAMKKLGLVKKGKYETYTKEEFIYSFFTAAGEMRKKQKNYDVTGFDPKVDNSLGFAIKLADGTKCYVAKFWGSDDLGKLLQLVKKDYGVHFHVEGI